MHAWRSSRRVLSGLILSLLAMMASSAFAESGKPKANSQPVKTSGGSHIIKWVDEKGVTHYGDTMPVQDSARASSEMTRQGILVKRNQPATPEAVAKKNPEQERRDRALLASYSNEQEIDLTRDRNLELAQTNNKALESRMEAAQRQLGVYKKQADDMTAKKKKIPDDLTADLQSSQAEVDKIQAQLKQTQVDMDATRARFDQDKLRFRELKAAQGEVTKQP
jgi:hypothetical protein